MQTRSSGFIRISRLVVALALLAACGDPPANRFELGLAEASQRFGDDGRLALTVEAGRVSVVDDQASPLQVTARSAGPVVTAYLDNGSVDELSIVLTIDNVSPSHRFTPAVSALPGDARRDPLCADLAIDGRSRVLLGALTPVAQTASSASFLLAVPRCTRLEIVAQPDSTTDEVRIAVIGTIGGDRSYLIDAIEAAASIDVDYVHFLGNVSFASDTSAFENFLALAATLDRPFGVSIGARDAREGTAGFIATFGAANSVLELGHTRFVMLDSASARISDDQRAMIDGMALTRQPGVVVSHQSPLAFGTSDGARSVAQGAWLVEALASRGFTQLLVGAGAAPDSRTFGGVRVHDLAGGGRGSENRALAVVTVSRPWSVLEPCVTSADCQADDRCDRGFCRRPCESDSGCEAGWACGDVGRCIVPCAADGECPGAAPMCVDNACNLDPEIAVETSAF